MMEQAIKDFAKQFEYQPKIENSYAFKPMNRFVVCGMGGSHLNADLLKAFRPELDIVIHSDYGLPQFDLSNHLIVASSYSGNTEETIDAFKEAVEKKLPVIAISTGGKLLDLAKAGGMAYIQMPSTGIQPRSALGLSLRALALATGQESLLEQTADLASILKPESFFEAGKKMAKDLKNQVPVIYSSARNFAVAYNWKIKLNETGKIPAFCNVIPELNHNEMNGFDVQKGSKQLSKNFHFIFIQDSDDHPRVSKRFQILAQQYKNRKLKVTELNLNGKDRLEKVFSSLLLADWLAFHTAHLYGLSPDDVPMVEEFKKMID